MSMTESIAYILADKSKNTWSKMSKTSVNVDDVFSGTFKKKVTDLSKRMKELHLSNSD